MTPTSYRQLLRDPRWQRRRLQILERDHWQCQQCGNQERELQVHHRWYHSSGIPWEVPDNALATLCIRCHEEISMVQNKPVLMQHSTMSDQEYGIIPTARAQNKFHYIARDPLAQAVARKHHKNPELLWKDYLVAEGGHAFRDEIMRSVSPTGGLDLRYVVEFPDETGMVWILRRFALHFVSKYDLSLEQRIYQHFDETALADDASPQGPSMPATNDPMALIKLQSQHIMTIAEKHQQMTLEQQRLAQEQRQLQGNFLYLAQHQIIHEKRLVDVESRLTHTSDSPSDSMIMRKYVATVLHRKVSDKQIYDWGVELSKELRCAWRDWKPCKVWDDHSQRDVNNYKLNELNSFFRSKGLL